MLGANRAADAGEGDVDRLGERSVESSSLIRSALSTTSSIAAFSSLTRIPASRLASFGAPFSHSLVDLCEDAVFARHPAIAKGLQDRRRCELQRLLPCTRVTHSAAAFSSAAAE
jgi:hypothetical protein